MADPTSALLGYLLSRTILVSAVIVTAWTAWLELYVVAAGLLIPLLYFVYLGTRPTDLSLTEKYP